LSAPLKLSPKEAIQQYGLAYARDLARAGLWAKGDLSFLLHEGQKELLQNFREKDPVQHVWNIGRRYGKSTAACVLATETALAKKRSRILYVASTHKSLVDNVIPMFETIASTAPLHLRPKIVADVVIFPNGSKIFLYGVEDRKKANRIRGGKAHLIVIDEAAFIAVLDYAVTDILLPMLTDTGGKMLLCSTPPESMTHPFRDLAEAAEALDVYTQRSVYDAPQYTREQIERLAESFGCTDMGTAHAYKSPKWLREFEAKWVVDPENSLVPEFEALEETIVVSDYPRPMEYDRYSVGDVGFTDLTAFLFASFDFPNQICYVENELFVEQTTSAGIAKGIDAREADTWGEPLGNFAKHELWADAQSITRADLGTEDRFYRMVNTKDPDEAVAKLRTNLRKFRIHERCKNLIAHLRHGTWNRTSNRSTFARSAGLGHFDGVAALMYLNRHLDWNHDPATPIIHSMIHKFVPASQQTPWFANAEQRTNHQIASLFKTHKRKRV
jgi:hypothetical protein